MKHLAILLLLAPLLAGCASLGRPDPAVTLAQDRSSCEAFGYTKGTDAYAVCMQTRDRDRQSDRRARLDRIAAAGAQLASPPPDNRINCLTTNTGYGSAVTSCR